MKTKTVALVALVLVVTALAPELYADRVLVGTVLGVMGVAFFVTFLGRYASSVRLPRSVERALGAIGVVVGVGYVVVVILRALPRLARLGELLQP